MSLSSCLKRMGLSAHEGAILRGKVDTLKSEGYDAHKAAVEAVKDHIAELTAQRADVTKQLTPSASPNLKGDLDDGLSKTSRSISEHDFGNVTPAQKQALKNTGGFIEKKTVRQRLAAIRKDAGMKMAQGIADQFAPIKALDQHAYLLSRLSKGSDGALEAMMLYGNLKLLDGVTDTNVAGMGVIESLQKLEGEHHRFMWWVAAHRADQLTAEDRENLFSAQDIAALKTLNQGTLGDKPGARSRDVAYKQALAEYNRASRNILDIAEQSGIIDGKSRAMWEKEFYVPFYRAIENGKSGTNIASGGGLVRQYAFKTLKGGKDKLQQDLLANVLMNWSHLLSASAKNRAARAALIAAENAGVATEQPGFAVSGRAIPKDVVWYMEHGEKSYYTVDDPLVVSAITSLEAGVVGGAAGELLSKFKNALTIGVTANPAFKLRNIARDSIASLGLANMSYNMAGNVASGVRAMADKKGQTYGSLLAGGGLIRFGAMLDGNRSSHVDKLVKAGVARSSVLDTREKMMSMLRVGWDHYNELGDISEGANRASLYMQARKRGATHAQASLEARDLMDFSMGGSWAWVRFLAQTVPFMNARVQGLYKMGRAAKESPARMAAVMGAVALASAALMLYYRDDDDWKKRPDWDRDNYWWFKIGDEAFRLPKPFEFGVVGTLAERGLELMVDDEMTAKRFRARVMFAISQTFAMDPTPQLLKPVWDVAANKDSFTGERIESAGMEKLPVEQRANQRTSEFAKAASSAMGSVARAAGGQEAALSPVHIDHLVRGYLGWLGTVTLLSSDAAVQPFLDRPASPSRQLKDIFVVGNFAESLPADRSRYVTQFYNQADEINKAYEGYRAIKAGGTSDQAAAYKEENAAKIKAEPKAAAFQRQLSEINAAVRKIEANREMDGDEKRTRISLLYSRRNAIAERASRQLESATQ